MLVRLRYGGKLLFLKYTSVMYPCLWKYEQIFIPLPYPVVTYLRLSSKKDFLEEGWVKLATSLSSYVE